MPLSPERAGDVAATASCYGPAMSALPDFATIPFEPTPVPGATATREPWTTPEGLAVAPRYAAADLSGLDALSYTHLPLPTVLRV